MKRYRILPYRQGSAGAKALATALGGKVLKLEGSSFFPSGNDVVINWGNTNPPANLATSHGDFMYPGFINDPNDIRKASNKLNFFNLMKGAGLESIIPAFWARKEDIPDEAFPVVCRTVLAGHSGDGIVIAADRAGLVHAPLYTQYVKKQDEYRIHVGMRTEYYGGGDHGEPVSGRKPVVISTQRKARRNGFENPNWQVRNHSNGFVYVRQGVSPPASVIEAAKKALEASGLDFGAVDVIYNSQQGKAYVLEINTAPGLEGQTVEDYAKFFRGDS